MSRSVYLVMVKSILVSVNSPLLYDCYNLLSFLIKKSFSISKIIESDIVAIKGQKEYAINRKRRGIVSNQQRKKQKLDKTSMTSVPADENFIGVDLNASGIVERVYLDHCN